MRKPQSVLLAGLLAGDRRGFAPRLARRVLGLETALMLLKHLAALLAADFDQLVGNSMGQSQA